LIVLCKLTGFKAEITGLSLDMLVRAVYLVELRLQIWVATEKRRELSDRYGTGEEINTND
jgi:hypothetical protein